SLQRPPSPQLRNRLTGRGPPRSIGPAHSRSTVHHAPDPRAPPAVVAAPAHARQRPPAPTALARRAGRAVRRGDPLGRPRGTHVLTGSLLYGRAAAGPGR